MPRDPKTGKFVKAEKTEEGVVVTTDVPLGNTPPGTDTMSIGLNLPVEPPEPLLFIPRAAYLDTPTVPAHVKAKRRAKNKAARAARRRNR